MQHHVKVGDSLKKETSSVTTCASNPNVIYLWRWYSTLEGQVIASLSMSVQEKYVLMTSEVLGAWWGVYDDE